jgi:uncharacterized protein (UPF0262 family)
LGVYWLYAIYCSAFAIVVWMSQKERFDGEKGPAVMSVSPQFGSIEIDQGTARRLFALVSALRWRV